MNQRYDDILSRVSEPPRWFDEQAVPRYCEFTPACMANIYAHEGALIEIACQACGHPFLVAIDAKTANQAIQMPGQETAWRTLADLIRGGEIAYGDPPNIGCCGVGPSMTSITRRVLQYWHRYRDTDPIPGSTMRLVRGGALRWQRDPTLEIAMPASG